MTPYNPPILSIAVLDFQRPDELSLLLESLDRHLKVPASIVYCHDGQLPDYALEHFRKKRIHTLITTSENMGCGVQTRQLFQACMTPGIIYCQVDQFLIRDFTENDLQSCFICASNDKIMYVDLAGNQGNGNPSERASFYIRQKYLMIPGINGVIGGPGPFADHKWTEQHLQEHIKNNNLQFATVNPPFFGDNGKWSRRSYLCGGETLHSTDEKVLKIIKPLKQRYDFPNLKLSESEWQEVLENRWPAEGKIPEADKPHSFKAW